LFQSYSILQNNMCYTHVYKKRSIPSVIIVFATPMFSEIIIHLKKQVVELTVTTAQNIGVGPSRNLELETT
jgi:hypothetical protein